MKKISFINSLLLILAISQTASANQPPGPQMFLAEILILPIMMALSGIGGRYIILDRQKGISKRENAMALFIAIAVIMGICSGMHEGYSFIFTMFFGLVALVRALQMIGWGLKAILSKNRPDYLVDINPIRLISAGSVLILITVLLMGTVVAFIGYWSSRYRVENLKKFLAYQLAYAQLEQEKTGEFGFRKASEDEFVSKRFMISEDQKTFRIEYGPDYKSFTAYILPSARFPFFPYNYLTSQPTYRADQTGEIKMIYVHHNGVLCPADAPIVIKISDADIKEQKIEIKGLEKVLK